MHLKKSSWVFTKLSRKQSNNKNTLDLILLCKVESRQRYWECMACMMLIFLLSSICTHIHARSRTHPHTHTEINSMLFVPWLKPTQIKVKFPCGHSSFLDSLRPDLISELCQLRCLRPTSLMCKFCLVDPLMPRSYTFQFQPT